MDLHTRFPDVLRATPIHLPTIHTPGPGTRVATALGAAGRAWHATLVDAHRRVDKQVAEMTALSRELLDTDAALARRLR